MGESSVGLKKVCIASLMQCSRCREQVWTHNHSYKHMHKARWTHTYPSPQAPEAVHFGFGGHEVVEAMGEGLLVLLGRLGVVGNSRG